MLEVNETGTRILAAAQKVFIRKGFSGSTMENIANEANVNKAALHYYFRSKEKLFELILKEIYMILISKIKETLETKECIEDIIKELNNCCFEILSENPYWANFIMNELSTNPHYILELVIKNGRINFSVLRVLVLVRNKIFKKSYDLEYSLNFILNLISVNIFPYLIRPLIISLFKMEDANFFNFMKNRKIDSSDFVLKVLK